MKCKKEVHPGISYVAASLMDTGPTIGVYSPKCLEGEFRELRLYRVLGSCAKNSFGIHRFLLAWLR